MIVKVKLFGAAQETVGHSEVEVELPRDATVALLRRTMGDHYPSLRDLLDRTLFAVDAEYAADDRQLEPQHDVACIPPVSGG